MTTSVTRKLNKKIAKFLEKVAKNTKSSTSKLNLKAQNFKIKLLLKWVETASLGGNWLSKN